MTHLIQGTMRSVVLLPQPNSYPHMDVAENMSFALRLAGRPAPEIRAKVAAARVLNIHAADRILPKRAIAFIGFISGVFSKVPAFNVAGGPPRV
jgi:hypothetical protein